MSYMKIVDCQSEDDAGVNQLMIDFGLVLDPAHGTTPHVGNFGDGGTKGKRLPGGHHWHS